MGHPVEDIIGDYRAFAAQQSDRLAARGIDITPYQLSHLAYRVPEWDQYVHVRSLLERHAVANRENLWNGRPISLIVPAQALEVLGRKVVPLIELIPPVHQRVYKMGLEHLGVVVGTLSTRSSMSTSPSEPMGMLRAISLSISYGSCPVSRAFALASLAKPFLNQATTEPVETCPASTVYWPGIMASV